MARARRPKGYNTNRARNSRTEQRRRIVHTRDRGICHLCNHPAAYPERWELDHYISQEASKIAGLPPDDSIRNLRVAHSTKYPCPTCGCACNQVRGHRPAEYAIKYIAANYNPGNSSKSEDEFEEFEDCVIEESCPHGKAPGKYCFDCKGSPV